MVYNNTIDTLNCPFENLKHFILLIKCLACIPYMCVSTIFVLDLWFNKLKNKRAKEEKKEEEPLFPT